SCPQGASLQTKRWLALQRARLLACDHSHVIFTLPHDLNPLWLANVGVRVTFTCRARQEEADSDSPVAPRLTLSVAGFVQPRLLHVPVPQTRVVRSYGLSHASQADVWAVCHTALGQPPVEVPVALDWQTVCAQRGDLHPARCRTCGQLLVCTEVIPRAGAP